MAVREVKPFDAKQWAQLQKEMKQGQTEEQMKRLQKGRENIKLIPHPKF